ncbi:hypothetical protein DF044_31735 [Burkholderia contaminans]|nr:hypothetical protein DF044_31735 [Burkholderia contaminans]
MGQDDCSSNFPSGRGGEAGWRDFARRPCGTSGAVGEIHGGPDAAERAIDDIHGSRHRSSACVAQKTSATRDARVPAAAHRHGYSQPLRMNSTIE